MAASGSTKVVIAALAANGLIAVAKFAAAAVTGSAAMLAEAIHSLADTANQGLLLLGIKRAARPPDAAHPFGHARELYFWAFVVAILLFSLGSGVAIYEGVTKLRNPHPIEHAYIVYLVLGVAMVFEGISTAVALKEFNATRTDEGVLGALRSSKDPALYTVLLEDVAALVGLVVAMAGVAAADFLGWTTADAIASIIIGLILGGVAAFMSIETKSLLIGEAASPTTVAGIRQIIGGEMKATGPVDGLNELRTMQLGPHEILVAASLDFKEHQTAKDVEATIGRLDAAIKAKYPDVTHLYLEVQDAEKPRSIDAAAAATDYRPAHGENATLLDEPSANSAGNSRKAGGTTPLINDPTGNNETPRALPLQSSGRQGTSQPRGNYPPSKSGKTKRKRR
jgi:cation diffusion facilitator family transporter